MKSTRLLGLFLILLCASVAIYRVPEVELAARQPSLNLSPDAVIPLEIALHDGKKAGHGAVDSKLAEGSPLAPDRTKILAKMFAGPLPAAPSQPKFFKRPDTMPPPRSAKVKPMAFPPAGNQGATPEATEQKLQVVSIYPQGDLERAPKLSISFNSPMVAVSALQNPDQSNPLGITLDPCPAGNWRWLGTQTLVFEPSGGEFPRATRYQLTIPAGLPDLQGHKLEKAQRTSFTLAAPKVEAFSPTTDGQTLNPLIYLVFDQPMDANRTLPLFYLEDAWKRLRLTRLSVAEAEKLQPGVQARFKDYKRNRVFFFRPARPLEPGRTYYLRVAKGVKGKEGPLLSTEAENESFSTYDRLKLYQQLPEVGKKVRPDDGFLLTFTNELEQDRFQPDWVSVRPHIKGFRVRCSGSRLYLDGDMKADTTYEVTVSSRLTDVFGQRLGKDLKLTLKTGKAVRRLDGNFEDSTLLQPQTAPVLPVFTTNVKRLRVRVSRVDPQDWLSYLKFGAGNGSSKNTTRMPGKPLADIEVRLTEKPDELVATRIDLSSYLDHGEGNLVVWVSDPDRDKDDYRDRDRITWVQGTPLGIDMETGARRAVVMATDLATGKPVRGARVQLGNMKNATGADGTCVLDMPAVNAPFLLVASGRSQAFLPYSRWDTEDGWSRTKLTPADGWYLFDDRGLYRPGERARIKGYVRSWQRGPLGQLVLPKADSEVKWTFKDPRGKKIKEGTTTLDAYGALELDVPIPPNTDLGYCSLSVSSAGLSEGEHLIQVEEFRRPEFELTTQALTDGPHLLFESATVEARANYYSGGGLAGNKISWDVRTQPSSYTPPGREDYTFGEWTPWWSLGDWWSGDWRPGSATRLTYDGKTDSDGTHQLAMDFLRMSPPRPTDVEVTATVIDLNRQEQSSTTHLLVHPSERYVGLKAEKSFVEEGESFELEAIVTDVEGRLLAGVPLEVQLFKVDYERSSGDGQQQKEVPVETRELISAEGPLKLAFKPKDGGTFRLRARVVDKKGRPNQTEYTVWKTGAQLPGDEQVKVEELTVVPDKKEYKPGDAARILVMAPFAEGEGLVAWDRDGLLSKDRFTLKNGTAVITLPVTEKLIPNVHASITVEGKTKWKLWERPAVATADLNLSVSTASRKLTVEINPSKKVLDPGATVDIPVVVKDHQGRPVPGAQVTLWVADEAVLGLAGYTTPDPLARFYPDRPAQLNDFHNRQFVMLGEPMPATKNSGVPLAGDLPVMGSVFRNNGRIDNDGNRMGGGNTTIPGPGYLNYNSLVGATGGERFNSAYGFDIDGEVDRRAQSLEQLKFYGEADKKGTISAQGLLGQQFRVTGDIDPGAEFSAYTTPSKPPTAKFAVRKDFNALAEFKGALKTDASGFTSVRTKLPDSLTRYRIIAVAVKEADKFGHAEAPLTARLPLMVKPSLPRFLNFGDKARLSVVLQNQTDTDMAVEVVGETSGLTLLGPAGRKVKVPANDRVEVPFEASADKAGEATVRFGAVCGRLSDAATVTLPVYTPTGSESFATYGQIGESGAVRQQVRKPSQACPQFGGLQVSLSSTALSELTDAFLYLYQYPYECSEQKASRMLAVTALGDVLEAFNAADMPSPQAISARMQADISHLERTQMWDNGWDYWVSKKNANPFVTVHVMHALARAKSNGYNVKSSTLTDGLSYLGQIEAKCVAKNYDKSTIRSLTAYALYVRNLLHDPDVAAAKALFAKIKATDNPDLEALGWIWPTLLEHAKGSAELQELQRIALNKVTQTADTAQFSTGVMERKGYLILRSSRRVDALLLAGLLQAEPANPLNTKLVRGLLAGRDGGRWDNTQENIWVLLALQSYFRAYEKEAPNFVAGLWLDKAGLGQEQFSGRSAKEAQLKIPMQDLAGGEHALTLSKQGAGRLYYRVGLTYAPKSLILPAESRGFAVERSYQGADKVDDVTTLENGDLKIKAGAKVKVTLTLVCPERRYHVALVDRLPAGLEPLNPALKGAGSDAGESYSWWNWYDHDNLRDERVEAFASELAPGVYTYTYTARATTPGEYILPSLHAEEMYSPEVFGRTATARVTVD